MVHTIVLKNNAFFGDLVFQRTVSMLSKTVVSFDASWVRLNSLRVVFTTKCRSSAV